MGNVTCYYLESNAGRSPVLDFIDSLDPRTQRKFLFVRALLESSGRRLPRPHAKYLGDAIFELRFMGREGQIRVLYFFFDEDKAIFTNGFIKKSSKVPFEEKAKAVQRRTEFLGQRGGIR